jgi:hypothetical protein
MSRKGAAVQQPELPMKDITPKRATGTIKPGDTITDAKTGKTGKVLSVASSPKARKKKGTAVAVAQPQAPKEAKNMLAIIADAASNPAINPENMRALLDMQKEIMADQAKRDFNAAFIALQADLSHVSIRQDGKIEVRKKDSSGERTGAVQQATPYATFNNIMKAIRPLLVKHGFTLSFATEPMGERLLVKGLLEGYGHERTTAFPLPAETSGSKNNVQGWGSSMSYGKRYCTIALLNIISDAPEDRDTDGHPNKPTLKPAKGGGLVDVEEKPKVTEEQAIKLRELIEWCGVGTKKFNDHYGIAKVSDLPADLFAAASKSCEDFHASQQRKNG